MTAKPDGDNLAKDGALDNVPTPVTRYSCTGVTLYTPTDPGVPPRCFGIRSKFMHSVLDLPPVPGSSSVATAKDDYKAEEIDLEDLEEIQSHDVIDMEDADLAELEKMDLEAWCIGYSRYTPAILVALDQQRARSGKDEGQLALPVCMGGLQVFNAKTTERDSLPTKTMQSNGVSTAGISAADFYHEDDGGSSTADEVHIQTQIWLEGYARTKSLHDPREFTDLITKMHEMEDSEIRRYRRRKLDHIQHRCYEEIRSTEMPKEQLEIFRVAQLASQAAQMSFPPQSFDKHAILKHMKGHHVQAASSRGLPHLEIYKAEEKRRQAKRKEAESRIKNALSIADSKEQTVGFLGGPMIKDDQKDHLHPPQKREGSGWGLWEKLQDVDAADIPLTAVSAFNWTYKFWSNLLDGFPAKFEKRARANIEVMPKVLDRFMTAFERRALRNIEFLKEVKDNFGETIDEIMRDDGDDDDGF